MLRLDDVGDKFLLWQAKEKLRYRFPNVLHQHSFHFLCFLSIESSNCRSEVLSQQHLARVLSFLRSRPIATWNELDAIKTTKVPKTCCQIVIWGTPILLPLHNLAQTTSYLQIISCYGIRTILSQCILFWMLSCLTQCCLRNYFLLKVHIAYFQRSKLPCLHFTTEPLFIFDLSSCIDFRSSSLNDLLSRSSACPNLILTLSAHGLETNVAKVQLISR